MPSSNAYANLKAPATLVLILTVIITVLYFAPPLVPLPGPEPIDRTKAIIDALENSPQTPPCTSDDLKRFRALNLDSVSYPSDPVVAAEHLAACESLWNELQEIVQEPGFRRERFAEHTPLGNWKCRADAFHLNRPPKEILGGDLYALSGNMIAVAIDYATNPLYPKKPSVIEEWFVNCHLPSARETVRYSSHSGSGE